MTAGDLATATPPAVIDRRYSSEKPGLRRTVRNPQMLVCEPGCDAAPGSALKEADLKQIGFVNVFDGIDFFAQDSGDRVDAHGAATESFDDSAQEFPVDVVETVLINVEEPEGVAGNGSRDLAGSLHLRIISSSLQQAIRNARRAAAPRRDFLAAFRRDRRIQNFGGPANDEFQLGLGVEIQPVNHTEAGPQWRRDQAGASGRSDQREAAQIQTVRPGAGPLTDDDVELEVLHRGIEDFLDIGLEPMNLVDEKHIAEFEVCQNRSQITLHLDQRAGGRTESCPHFVGNNGSECCLTQPGRTIQKNVVERLTALARGLDGYVEVVLNRLLANVLRNPPRTKR